MEPRLPPGQIVPASRSPSNPAWLTAPRSRSSSTLCDGPPGPRSCVEPAAPRRPSQQPADGRRRAPRTDPLPRSSSPTVRSCSSSISTAARVRAALVLAPGSSEVSRRRLTPEPKRRPDVPAHLPGASRRPSELHRMGACLSCRLRRRSRTRGHGRSSRLGPPGTAGGTRPS
jgi:hypothetical protein